MASTPEPRIVKKAGEGYDKPAEPELPIDINYQKLAEWLVSWCLRRCNSGCLEPRYCS